MKFFKVNMLFLIVGLLLGLTFYQSLGKGKYFPDNKSGRCINLQQEFILNEGRNYLSERVEKLYEVKNPTVDFPNFDSHCNYYNEHNKVEIKCDVKITWNKGGHMLGENYKVYGKLIITPTRGFIKKYEMRFEPSNSPKISIAIEENTKDKKKKLKKFLNSVIE